MTYPCAIFNELANSLIPYESELFLWLNGQHNAFFDSFMSIYSGKVIWLPFIIVALGVFTIKTKSIEALLVVVAIVLVCTLCDQLASSIIKPMCERVRPTHYPGIESLVHTVDNYRGGRFGFISSHSANGFGAATFASLLFRQRLFSFAIFLWASVTAYSRIYLGVHFISDVAGGIMVGCLIGWAVYILYTKARNRFLHLTAAESRICAFEPFRANILIYTLSASVLVIASISTIRLF
jgi:undecaprenyl-diphosphatase